MYPIVYVGAKKLHCNIPQRQWQNSNHYVTKFSACVVGNNSPDQKGQYSVHTCQQRKTNDASVDIKPVNKSLHYSCSLIRYGCKEDERTLLLSAFCLPDLEEERKYLSKKFRRNQRLMDKIMDCSATALRSFFLLCHLVSILAHSFAKVNSQLERSVSVPDPTLFQHVGSAEKNRQGKAKLINNCLHVNSQNNCM